MQLRRSRTALMAIACASATALATFGACGDDDPTDPDDGVEIINLTDFQFSRADLTIPPGTTVRWVNQTNTIHTVTPDGHSEWTRWETTSEGESFEHTFNTAGTFEYICEPHEALGMTGVVRVQ